MKPLFLIGQEIRIVPRTTEEGSQRSYRPKDVPMWDIVYTVRARHILEYTDVYLVSHNYIEQEFVLLYNKVDNSYTALNHANNYTALVDVYLV